MSGYQEKINDFAAFAIYPAGVVLQTLGGKRTCCCPKNSVLSRCQYLAQLLAQEKAVMEILKAEVIEVLRGISAFGLALPNDLIEKSESKIGPRDKVQ